MDNLADAPADPDELLKALEEGIDRARHKAVNGRVHDKGAERVRQGWLRTLAYLCQTHAQIRQTKDLEELADRLDALEATMSDETEGNASEWWTSAPAEVSE